MRSIETQFAEWRRILRSGTTHRQRMVSAAHAKARLFRIYEPVVVPGLLQTWDYALAVLSVTGTSFRFPMTPKPEHALGWIGRRSSASGIGGS